MKSIIQTEKECFITGKKTGLESHHIFGGNPNRKNSEKYGLKVWLCYEYHRGDRGVHNDEKLALWLHKVGQRAFEDKCGTREDFVRVFGRNYL